MLHPTQRDGTTTQTSSTNNYYDSDDDPATIADYALGALVRSTTSVSRTNSPWSSSSVTNAYQWRDGAVLSSANLSGTTSGTTVYHYSGTGVMTEAVITDGRSRTVTFTTDVNGQVIRRKEADNGTGGDPNEIWYRFNGRQLGQTGNTNHSTAPLRLDGGLACFAVATLRLMVIPGIPRLKWRKRGARQHCVSGVHRMNSPRRRTDRQRLAGCHTERTSTI